jgi:hypothetical protein
MPYHVTWVHETHAPDLSGDAAARLRAVATPADLPGAVASLAAAASAASRLPIANGANA